jgi:hypothetical protein
MEYKNSKVCTFPMQSDQLFTTFQTGAKRVLFDVAKNGQNISPKWVPPEEEQEANESRRYVEILDNMRKVIQIVLF